MITKEDINETRTNFSNQQWDELTINRKQLPPCCSVIAALASTVRSIRSFDLDVIVAKDYIRKYNIASEQHDLTMFDLLTELYNQCLYVIGLHEKYSLGQDYIYEYDW